MEQDSFYRELPSFSDFAALAHGTQFKPVPSDWLIVMTDVKNSTGAIAAGRYRDVNTIGAAAIVAVSNAIKSDDFPFVFGGDGATCLIPPSDEAAVRAALTGLKSLARAQFNVELRVGLVPVSEILKDGFSIDIGKYELTRGRCVAFFRGGGLTRAEEKLKRQPELYEVDSTSNTDVNLQGLSCRWRSMPSRRGRIVSLLVRARSTQPAQTYAQLLTRLNAIFDGHLQDADPVNEPALTYKSFFECVREERRFHRTIFSRSFLERTFGITFSVMIFKCGLPAIGFSARAYRKSMAVHSDYRKFDDMLRMVLDCSPKQVADIRNHLDELHHEGHIFYGIHEADTSLMTCFVGNVADGGHIHFIDGGDGGYAMAAVQLKAQVKATLDPAT